MEIFEQYKKAVKELDEFESVELNRLIQNKEDIQNEIKTLYEKEVLEIISSYEIEEALQPFLHLYNEDLPILEVGYCYEKLELTYSQDAEKDYSHLKEDEYSEKYWEYHSITEYELEDITWIGSSIKECFEKYEDCGIRANLSFCLKDGKLY